LISIYTLLSTHPLANTPDCHIVLQLPIHGNTVHSLIKLWLGQEKYAQFNNINLFTCTILSRCQSTEKINKLITTSGLDERVVKHQIKSDIILLTCYVNMSVLLLLSRLKHPPDFG
jgi:hypothetical protein